MSNLADLIDFEPNDVVSNMEIRSEKIVPQSSSASTNTYKFEITNIGYLDGNSMLTFKAVNKTATPDNLRANVFNGGLGAIKRCQFFIGDFVVCDFQDLSRMATLLSMNVPPSTRNNFMGHFIGNCFHTEASDSANGTRNGASGGTGSILQSADNGVAEGDVSNNYNGAVSRNRPILTNAGGNDKFGIPLSYIIPALQGGRKMPLFLFKDYRLRIEVEFAGAIDWVVNLARGAEGFTCASNNDVAYENVELLIDYILPPASVMNADEEASAKEGGYRFEFPNYITIKKHIPAVANPRELQEVDHRLGLNGREVHHIIQMKKYPNANKNESMLQGQRIDGVNDEEYNVEVNGVKLYPDFKFNNADQLNQVSYCLNRPLYVPRPMYFSDDNSIYSELVGRDVGMMGNFKPLCVDLTNGNGSVVGGGTIINNHPVSFQYRRRPCSSSGSICFDYKRAMDVSYYASLSRFVNVVSTPQGSNVVVSY
jgi:hypothetical protein